MSRAIVCGISWHMTTKSLTKPHTHTHIEKFVSGKQKLNNVAMDLFD